MVLARREVVDQAQNCAWLSLQEVVPGLLVVYSNAETPPPPQKSSQER